MNAIPERAGIKVDLRSESDSELGKIERALRQAMQTGLDEEMAASKNRGYYSPQPLAMETKVLGVRPSGELPAGSPLLDALKKADEYLGNRSRMERSSTDANIPLSLGVPAIALGAGGRSGGAHSLGEWYEPAGRELGLRRVLLTMLQLAGIEPTGAPTGN